MLLISESRRSTWSFSFVVSLFRINLEFLFFSRCPECITYPISVFVGSYVAGQLSGCGALNILNMYLDVRSQQHLLRHHIGRFEERTTFYKRIDKKCLVNAASGHPLESEPGAYKPKSIGDSFKNALDAFYRFSRPHTVIGTVKFKVDSINWNKPCLESYGETNTYLFFILFSSSFFLFNF